MAEKNGGHKMIIINHIQSAFRITNYIHSMQNATNNSRMHISLSGRKRGCKEETLTDSGLRNQILLISITIC